MKVTGAAALKLDVAGALSVTTQVPTVLSLTSPPESTAHPALEVVKSMVTPAESVAWI